MNRLRLTVTLLIATVVLAATTASALQEEQMPRFRAEVRAVLVDVLVLDGEEIL